MQLPSAGEWVAIIAIIVTAGFITGIIVAWREEKRREREEKERRELWRAATKNKKEGGQTKCQR